MFSAAFVCGIASAIYLFTGRPAADRRGGGGGGAGGGVRADRAGHRPALGAQGVGRVVAVGRAAHVGAGPVDDLRRRTCCCGASAAPARRSWRRRSRSSAWPTCRSSTGRSTSGAPSIRKRPWSDAAAGHGAAVLWCVAGAFICCSSCCWSRACGSRRRAELEGCISRSRTDMMTYSRDRGVGPAALARDPPAVLCRGAVAAGSLPHRQPPATAAQDGFLPVTQLQGRRNTLPAAPLVIDRLCGRLGRDLRLRLVAVVAPGEGRARNRGGQPAHRRRARR